MRWKFEQRYPKTTVDSIGEKMGQFVADDFARQIGKKILNTVHLTVTDPYPSIAGTQFLNGPGSLMPEVAYQAELVHLPIEQWQHIKRMLRLLETTPQAVSIVQQIIGEIEYK